MQEHDLVAAARDGDRESFGQLVRMHQARLRAFGARYVDNSDDIYDLVQDTFLAAYQSLNTFDESRDFAHWLTGIFRNRIHNYYRSRRVRASSPLTEVDLAICARIPESEPADDNVARIQALKKCIGSLQPDHLEMVQMRYRDGKPIREIAEKFTRSEPSVSMLLMRVRNALLKCIQRQSPALKS